MNTFSEYYALITVSMTKVKNSGQQPGDGPWSGLERFLFSFTFFVDGYRSGDGGDSDDGGSVINLYKITRQFRQSSKL